MVSENPFLDLYSDHERQQTSPRAQQKTLMKNVNPVKSML